MKEDIIKFKGLFDIYVGEEPYFFFKCPGISPG
jgi:hypothetical protein